MAATIHDMTTKFAKLDKFEGNDFRRWKKKMHFMLTKCKKKTMLYSIPKVIYSTLKTPLVTPSYQQLSDLFLKYHNAKVIVFLATTVADVPKITTII
ncbi:hypothetical protein LXL04_033757 [Taraxacum kok-saghyz]